MSNKPDTPKTEDEKPKNETDKSFDWSLANLIRLLREITLLLVLAYLSYSLISGKIGISFGTKELTASEIISILLAFFAILLSAAFYYMSTQQSNLFYHNVHQFTKDTSEILGRLDEQVKNIGGKQTELKDTFEKNYTYNNSLNDSLGRKEEKIVEEVIEKEERLKEKEGNIIETVNSLIEKVKFNSDEEKKELISTLAQQRQEIDTLRSDLEKKANLMHLMPKVKYFTTQLIKDNFPDKLPNRPISSIFREIINNQVSDLYINDLELLGYLTKSDNGEHNITRKGLKFFSEIIREIDNN